MAVHKLLVKSKCKQDSQNVSTKLLSLLDKILPYSGLSRAVCTVRVNQIAEFSYVTLITLWPILCTSWCCAVWQSSDHFWCCWEKEWGVKSSLIYRRGWRRTDIIIICWTIQPCKPCNCTHLQFWPCIWNFSMWLCDWLNFLGTRHHMAMLPDPFSIFPKGVWAWDYTVCKLMTSTLCNTRVLRKTNSAICLK